MKVNQVGQSVQTQQVQRKGRKSEASPVKQNGDKVEISSEARKLQNSSGIQATAAKTIRDTSDVREDRIADVRQRIAEGFYNQSNIATALADKLLKEFGI